MKRFASCAVLLLTLAAVAGAQPPERLDPDARERADAAATKALRTFGLLVNQSNFEDLGFANPGEVREATLGDPLEEFMIRLDYLRAYEPDQRGLVITPTRRLTYPLTVAGEQRSSLTVGQADSEGGDHWDAVAFGGPNYARLLVAARQRLAVQNDRPPDDYFEIRVPALNVSFIAYQEGDGLFLMPLLEDPRFDFGSEEAIPFERALEVLQPAAREHNGLPT